jgi:hypothetical protein
MASQIDDLFEENNQLLSFLDSENEISFRSCFDDTFRKILLLSSASYFENKVLGIIEDFINKKANDEKIRSFIQSSKMKDRYFKLFDWRDRKPQNCDFLHAFGKDFYNSVKADLKDSPDLEMQIKAFLEIGDIRNNMVHENFAIFPMDKSPGDIYLLHQNAERFIIYIEKKLLE